MTDIAGIVQGLRAFNEELLNSEPYTCEQRAKAAADALEAQAKGIKIYQQTELTYVTRVADAQREYSEMQAKLKARIAELEKELNAWHESANWPEKSPGRLRARIAELEAALKNWDALIRHQYTGSREAMSDMTVCAQETAKLLYGPAPWPSVNARAALEAETE